MSHVSIGTKPFIILLNFVLRFDGESYQSVAASEYDHRYTLGLANYREKALITGCYDYSLGCGLKTELMDMNTLTWSPGPDYSLTSE